MPRDELGLDPYQASAVSCAKQGAIISAVLALCAIGLVIYSSQVSNGEMFAYLGAGGFAGSVVSFVLANRCEGLPARYATYIAAAESAGAGVVRRRLKNEDIRWADVC